MNEQMNNMGASNNMCRCPHHKIVPLAVILIGVTFILQSLNILSGIWPMSIAGVLLIVVGAVKLGGRSCKCCSRP